LTRIVAKRTPKTSTLPFGAALLAARLAARVSRAQIAATCGVLPRTVARWEAGENDPDATSRELAILFLDGTGCLPRPLLEQLAESGHAPLWSLGIEPPPGATVAKASVFVPSAASQKVVDDAIREAAEDLAIPAPSLRPVVSRLLEAIARGGVPADAAARMAIVKRR
jgi:hypothetical protein